MERLVMGMVDGRLEKSEEHLVFPGVRSSKGQVESAGRWIERVLTCKAVVEVSAFRRAGHPDWGPVELPQLLQVEAQGARSTGRVTKVVDYGDSEGEDEPVVRKRRVRHRTGGGKKRTYRRLAALTEDNDPIARREPMVEVEDLSMDEVEAFLLGEAGEVVCIGDPGLTVGEWALSMLIDKSEAGKATMRSVCSLAEEFREKCDEVALGALGGFQLHRRVPKGMGMELSLKVQYEGWSGWAMLEWLARKRVEPGAAQLNLSRGADRGQLALFLESLLTGAAREVAGTLEKCLVRLVDPSFGDLQ